MECRYDFSRKSPVNEEDYVSKLTDRITRALSDHNLRCYSQVAEKNFEEENGIDGIMIFQSGDRVKIGLFEAKRPQVSKKNFGWDYLSSRKISHFSEQIKKQQIWKDQLAIWEMFVNETRPGGTANPPYDSFGSSCFWHDNAYSFMHTEKLIFQRWNTNKLKELLSISGINFYSIIYDILSCRAGKVHAVDQGGQFCTIQSQSNKEIVMRIPLPAQNLEEFKQIAGAFLNEHKINSLTYVDINSNLSISPDDDLPF